MVSKPEIIHKRPSRKLACDFKGQRGADVLLWNGLSLGVWGGISLAKCDSNVSTLCISVGGASPATRYSTQDMR